MRVGRVRRRAGDANLQLSHPALQVANAAVERLQGLGDTIPDEPVDLGEGLFAGVPGSLPQRVRRAGRGVGHGARRCGGLAYPDEQPSGVASSPTGPQRAVSSSAKGATAGIIETGAVSGTRLSSRFNPKPGWS